MFSHFHYTRNWFFFSNFKFVNFIKSEKLKKGVNNRVTYLLKLNFCIIVFTYVENNSKFNNVNFIKGKKSEIKSVNNCTITRLLIVFVKNVFH